MASHVSRRAVLGGIAAAGAGAVVLSSCGTSGSADPNPTGSGSGTTGGSGGSGLPHHIPFTGVTADFPGSPDGALDAFANYPTDPVAITDGAPGDGNPITALTSPQGTVPAPMGDNPFWQELNTRLGSQMDLTLVNTDYDSKLATTVAGGDLPDLVSVPYNTPARRADKAGMFNAVALDLSEYLAGDKIEAYPALANIPTPAWEMASFDGVVRAVPIHRGLASSFYMMVRQDICDEQGIEVDVTDYESLLDLCVAMTRPEENQFALARNPMSYLKGMFRVPVTWELNDDGTLTHELEFRDEYHGALNAAKELYDAGTFHPDWTTSGIQGALHDGFYGGSGLMTIHSHLAITAAYAANTDVEGFKVGVLGFPGHDGGDGTPRRGHPKEVHSLCFINNDSADRAETILGVLNMLAAPFGTSEYLFNKFGREGEEHSLNGSNPVVNEDSVNNVRLGQQYLADGPQVVYMPGREADEVQAVHDAQAQLGAIGVYDPTFGLTSETEDATGANFSTSLSDMENEVIQGRRSIADWDALVDGWLAGDGATIKAEYEEALANSQ
ncbi:hypothetical protein IM660_04900 [Ruania alkalisoli]|uniref:Extracellular solute-binding protein n=1 Tax=Ruania alkalisoli TaxID=2779775 RepID=A0A7M1SVN4_9MICO|nr:extracellular solute-binding protein [Ruania alkalisoli]QOR71629.1 hypothetical protein IM660_04900 [Ruania alkalisoli]